MLSGTGFPGSEETEAKGVAVSGRSHQAAMLRPQRSGLINDAAGGFCQRLAAAQARGSGDGQADQRQRARLGCYVGGRATTALTRHQAERRERNMAPAQAFGEGSG